MRKTLLGVLLAPLAIILYIVWYIITVVFFGGGCLLLAGCEYVRKGKVDEETWEVLEEVIKPWKKAK